MEISSRSRAPRTLENDWIDHEEHYLEYDPNVKIKRYRRQWKRHEVIGFFLVTIEIVCHIINSNNLLYCSSLKLQPCYQPFR